MGQDFNVVALLVARPEDRFVVTPPGKSKPVPMVGYGFHWLVHGKGMYTVDGKPYAALPGDVFLFRHGQIIQWDSAPLEPSTGYAITLWLEPTLTYWPPPSRWPTRRRLPDNDVIRPLFEYILGNALESGKPPPVLEDAIKAMMSAFICGPVIRPQLVPHVYPAAVQRVLNLIWHQLVTSTPHTKVSLDDLAAAGGVSREHLCRLFRQYVGYSPVEVVYLNRLARSLIGLNTGQTVEALATEFGFANASHYVRRFIALFGKSPAQMRRDMAKGYKPKLPKLPGMP